MLNECWFSPTSPPFPLVLMSALMDILVQRYKVTCSREGHAAAWRSRCSPAEVHLAFWTSLWNKAGLLFLYPLLHSQCWIQCCQVNIWTATVATMMLKDHDLGRYNCMEGVLWSYLDSITASLHELERLLHLSSRLFSCLYSGRGAGLVIRSPGSLPGLWV